MILGLGNGYIRVWVILGLGSHRGVVSRRIGHVESSHVESVPSNCGVLAGNSPKTRVKVYNEFTAVS